MKFKGDPKQWGRKQERKKDALVCPLLEGALKGILILSLCSIISIQGELAVRHTF